ncbi:hypothetical protein [Aureimonas frigidaquae]|uniref:Uncharacterized protein n=1 Tax=Aureimonas frigidaquae TaxID=424757 RepID=A0A0P0Z3G2_9HYPH|nr:hypothetical protein [Aureimonas frigidaquae]BAT28514.1 hypothetical protein [Aureimonas frigidaquae]
MAEELTVTNDQPRYPRIDQSAKGTAMSMIANELEARRAKTEKLRLMRKEAEAAAPAPVEKKKRVRKAAR